MLSFDDNMFRLAKMQETLLKVSSSNREENLKKYQEIVTQIDTNAFADILEKIKHIDEHNHSFEEELQYLEEINNVYNQLLELQLSFKNVCEQYGDCSLKLSDLSQLNIDYLVNRINAISGYLINLKNIEQNKEKIQKLNDQLVNEERKKELFTTRLKGLEEELIYNFINAEGRGTVNGQSQTISVISEYKKFGLDFEQLLDDKSLLNKVLSEAELEEKEKLKELEATQCCYNLNPNSEYKKFLDVVSTQYLNTKYKVRMLKMVQLLSQKHEDIDKCIEKREKLLDIINFRKNIIQELMGIRMLFDPFDRVKIQEQLEVITPFVDNSKTINRLRKEIGDLTSRTEEMMRENNNYLLTLNNKEELFQSKVGFNDIDISSVDMDFEEMLITKTKSIEPNQVVSVRAVSDKLNMSIVRQKVNGVIKRVNKMINRSINKKKKEVVPMLNPELVIVPTVSDVVKTELDVSLPIVNVNDNYVDESDEVEDVGMELVEEDVKEVAETPKSDALIIDSGLFETINPFEEPVMFSDRSDDAELSQPSNQSSEITELPEDLPKIESVDAKVVDFPSLENSMSDFSSEEESNEFWPSQDYSDEQIGKILSLNNRKAA